MRWHQTQGGPLLPQAVEVQAQAVQRAEGGRVVAERGAQRRLHAVQARKRCACRARVGGQQWARKRTGRDIVVGGEYDENTV